MSSSAFLVPAGSRGSSRAARKAPGPCAASRRRYWQRRSWMRSAERCWWPGSGVVGARHPANISFWRDFFAKFQEIILQINFLQSFVIAESCRLDLDSFFNKTSNSDAFSPTLSVTIVKSRDFTITQEKRKRFCRTFADILRSERCRSVWIVINFPSFYSAFSVLYIFIISFSTSVLFSKRRINVNLVELEKCCRTHLFLQQSASIQSRTDLSKFAKN